MQSPVYIQVILPLKLRWEPFYSIPEGIDVHIGQRVRVSLAGRETVAVVSATGVTPDVEASRIRPISAIAEGFCDITEEEIRFWRFISEYYLCTIGEVYKAAYPLHRVKSEAVAARRKSKEGAASAAGVAAAEFPAPCRTLASVPQVIVSPSRLQAYTLEIRDTLDKGSSVLVLVPETAAGDKMQTALRESFGENVIIYDSRLTAVRRRMIADSIREAGDPHLIIGTRSAIFLPFRKLGLIVVDEEQDESYKQSEPNPRYNARDAATVLASIHGAKAILGSSCPSMETEYNISRGKYRLLQEREDEYAAEVIDIAAERRKNGMKGMFSIKLCDFLREAENAILVRGWETEEEIREEAEALFPGKTLKIQTASSAMNESGHVHLIAVIQADAFFHRDDFRSDEKTLQLLHRLRSRTDRLVIQTAKSEHPVFSGAIGYPVGMFQERHDFRLPPFTRIVDVIISDDNPGRLAKMSSILSERLPRKYIAISSKDRCLYRFTVSGNSATITKKSIFDAVGTMERELRYQGHIVIDVDPA